MKSNFYSFGRIFALTILLFLFSTHKNVFAQQFLTSIDGWNAYVHLPDDYNDSVGKRYPLICFIPGTGECGTNASLLLSYGPSKFIADGNNMQFTVNGKLEKPIVISIQPASLWPSAFTINRKLDSIMARYRCDVQRVNVTGLSMGGWSWDNYVDGYSSAYTNRITSIVSLSAPEPDNTVSNMRHYAIAGGTAWFFEGNMDLRGNDKIRDTMNKYVAGSARYTMYSGGHCCWNTYYNPAWNENGESVYTWMLKQRKALIAGPVSPEAFAGRDSSISSLISNFNLKGTANDPNGLLINYSWALLSGPSLVTISNPSILQPSVTGLTFGTYKFQLTVTNALGLVGRDTIAINNGNIVLPVTLTDFSAVVRDKNNVLVQWKTSSELNFDYFVIEKSNNPQSFSEAARFNAKGTGSLGTPYYFTDFDAENGFNFYRLKMVDKDGQVTYSKVISISIKKENIHSVEIASVMASDNQIKLKISSTSIQQGIINVLDANGKRIYSSNISLNKGINNIYKNTYLPRGVYYTNFTSTTENISKLFIRE